MGQTKQEPTSAEVARRETQADKTTSKVARWRVSVDGINVVVSMNELDDFDLIDQIDKGNPFPMLAAWFGESYRQRIKPLETEDGHLKVSRVITWIGEVFKAVGAKNS